MSLTLRAARDDYFRRNGFPPDGGYRDKWADIGFGKLVLPFPNFKARRRAIRFHDLHHVLTGYATDMRGEIDISAWELGSGCGPWTAAWVINLGAVGVGAFVQPRRTFAAFRRGRGQRNLYRARYDAQLLARIVSDVRDELGIAAPPRRRLSDVPAYGVAVAVGLGVAALETILLLPLALSVRILRG